METSYSLTGTIITNGSSYAVIPNGSSYAPTAVTPPLTTGWPTGTTVVYPYVLPSTQHAVRAEADPLVWLRRRVDEICWQPPSR